MPQYLIGALVSMNRGGERLSRTRRILFTSSSRYYPAQPDPLSLDLSILDSPDLWKKQGIINDCTTLEHRVVIRFLNAEGIQTS
ncbi:hypothetical protein LAZ67_X003724 [Cordylochernes scorpioides]|uniref:Uncharacterized protein n=1 Tax=Cordylochernes scorpioides TaxID=51811 RepID=A0ABY6LXN5_9ARAC|nr:hypothetical protein LAZ67_X003724 [Cordylochernes scorpioides]